MSAVPSSIPEVLTSEERWSRWEQRGHDRDARFMRRAKRVLSAGLIAAIIIFAFVLMR